MQRVLDRNIICTGRRKRSAFSLGDRTALKFHTRDERERVEGVAKSSDIEK